MGYLDYAGLQYLWSKLREKFAPKSHSHDDRYYTETEMDGKLNSKVNNNEEGANGLINMLSTADSIPNDATVFISQHNDGKTASYYRRPISTLWTYIKSKTDSVYQPKGNYAASGHTHDDRYYTEAEVNSKLEAKASSDHTHGLNSSSLTKSVDNTTTNSWDMVGGNKDFLLRSLRMQAKAPDWLEDNYAAGIAFGGADTKGVISHAYNAPDIKFAGGNGAAPVWWLRLTGTSGKTYNLNAMPPASHTHTKDQVGLGNVDNTADANKSVKYAATATKAISADKATSASSADKAAKLTTARTVSGGSDITLSFNYDGSGNSTANIGFYSCKHSIGNTNNYPFHRFAKLDANKNALVDNSMTFLISQDYSGGGYGICRLVYRSNADSSSASLAAEWLVRKGLSVDTVQVAIKTDKTNGAYCDAFYKSSGGYMSVVIRAIASGGRASLGRTWTLINSNETDGTTATDKKTSSECWKTIADAGNELHKQAYSSSASAVDGGYVASAGSANSASTCTGNSASATKLTSSAGSATQPIYFKDGKPVAGTYTLGDASSKMVRTLSAQGNSGWANQTTDDKYVPTMSFMAYWNGAYGGTSSNLQYCYRGKFGTIVTKNSGDYAATGHTHNSIKDIGDNSNTTFAYSKAGMNYGDYAWLAGWNGYELRAVNKSQFATASHTHNYAGSGSAGGSANSAVKLDSSAGSATQPVYFKDGKPVATTYALNKTVPADAKFTDTDTWRGIQNNLTSDSTDQSLSAAQGKALKTLVDGKAPISHTHKKSQITDFPSSMPASDVYAWAKAATKPSYTKAEVGLGNVDNTADKNKNVKFATSAGSATNAQCLNNDSQYMRFHWNGQSGQPSWLWGGSDASNMYVYNPSNFSVNYANSAGTTLDAPYTITYEGTYTGTGEYTGSASLPIRHTLSKSYDLVYFIKNLKGRYTPGLINLFSQGNYGKQYVAMNMLPTTFTLITDLSPNIITMYNGGSNTSTSGQWANRNYIRRNGNSIEFYSTYSSNNADYFFNDEYTSYYIFGFNLNHSLFHYDV